MRNKDWRYWGWKKRLLSAAVLIVLFSVFGGAPAFAAPIEPLSEDGFYLISQPGHLEWFRDKVNEDDTTVSARLTADIDLQGIDWAQIGPVLNMGFDNRFNGTFDGNGKTISNLTVGSGAVSADFGEVNGGLFGYVGVNGVVRDLTVEDAVIIVSSATSYASAGIIAGTNGGLIQGCRVSGRVEAESITDDYEAYAGGIAGYARNDGRIVNCTADVEVKASLPNGIDPQWSCAFAGGIVGRAYGPGWDGVTVVIEGCTAGGGPIAAAGVVNAAGAIAGDLGSSAANCWFDENLAGGVAIGNNSGAPGNAQTAAYDPEGDLSALPIVTMFFERGSLEVAAGAQETLRVVTFPGKSGTLSWSIDDDAVAALVPAADGLSAQVAGKAEGATAIRCALVGGTGSALRCDLNVTAGSDDPDEGGKGSGGSSGCNAAGAFLSMLLLAPLLFRRKK